MILISILSISIAVEDTAGLMFKLDLLAHMMNIMVGTEQQECQQYELCLLGQRAQDAGGTLGDLIPLARWDGAE